MAAGCPGEWQVAGELRDIAEVRKVGFSMGPPPTATKRHEQALYHRSHFYSASARVRPDLAKLGGALAFATVDAG